MQFKQIWANLGVKDTSRTERFYTALGFKQNSSHTTPEITSFIFSENNFVIHFFRHDKLEPAMSNNLVDLTNGSEVIFSLSATSEQEVNSWAERAELAGGKIIKPGGRQDDGFYYCVFADPDGHKFNALFIEKGM